MQRIFIFYSVIIHVVLLIVLLKSDFLTHVERILLPDKEYNEGALHYHEMLAYHKRMDGNVPAEAIIFIGDSLTQSLAVNAIAPTAVNYGIGHDTSKGVLRRISEYKSIKRSKVVVIAIGINDLKFKKGEKILHNIEKTIKQIPKETRIIVNSIHPTDKNSLHIKSIKNYQIVSINNDLENMCSKYVNAHFLDTYKALSNENMSLSEDYHIGDGLHLNTHGYKVWINILKGKIFEIDIDK